MRPLLTIGLSLAIFTSMPLFAFAQANSVNGQGDRPLLQQGITAHNSGHYAEAASIWRQMLRAEPTSDIAYNNLGNALLKLGQLSEAEAAFRAAIRLAPNEAVRYYNLGNVLAEQGRVNEAIAAYKDTIRLDAASAAAYYNLTSVRDKNGRKKGEQVR
ncbi:MAG: tetratricopeptide repeat protein [Phormidesmis sp.]